MCTAPGAGRIALRRTLRRVLLVRAQRGRAEDTFRSDVFVRDRVLGTTRHASVASNGEEGDLDSLRAAINADALVIAFGSPSSTLELQSGQGLLASDVFVAHPRR